MSNCLCIYIYTYNYKANIFDFHGSKTRVWITKITKLYTLNLFMFFFDKNNSYIYYYITKKQTQIIYYLIFMDLKRRFGKLK